MVIGLKRLKEYEGKEIELIEFILDIDEGSNLINFALDPKEGIAVIETIQTEKRDTVYICRFKTLENDLIKMNSVFETMKRH